MMTPEKAFETKVKRWLTGAGIYALGTPKEKMTVPPKGYFEKRWGGGYSQSGLPDLHLVVNGISLDIELKSDKGRPSALQCFMIHQINECGSIALLLYPDGFQNFQEIIKGVLDCSSVTQGLNVLKAAHSSSNCDILTS